ncbi:MAG: HEAT repeat domain-containing protein [Planctomycetota bacterium]|nr:MAG: HEAT repeat domain-containing protein [Planctomycetota bacterium]
MTSTHQTGSPPARRALRRLAPASWILAAAVGLSSAALAQDDVQQTFEAGMQAYRNGDFDTAIARFREVVAMQPDNTTALQLMHDSQDELLQLLTDRERGEFEAFAREIIAAAGSATREMVRDPAAAAADAEGVFSDTYNERARAIFALRAKYGPFAVPPLVARLVSSNEQERANAIYALSRLGTEATIPLLAATESDQPEVRIGVLFALASLDDARAEARAADMAANDPDGTVRALAAKMAGGDAADLNYKQGWAYYVHDPAMGFTDVENHGVVWTINGARLEPRDVPPSLVPLELAKGCFERADALGNAQARTGLALVYGSEVAALQGLIGSGNEDLVPVHDAQAMAAQSLGQAALDSALQEAIRRGDVPTAAALIQLLDGAGLTARDGLRVAVAGQVPSHRFGAALALAHAGDTSPAVVSALTDGLKLQALRVVVLADPNQQRRAALTDGLAQHGVVVLASPDGATGLIHMRRSANVDAIVVADPLPDMYARRFVIETRKDPRREGTPVLVLGSEQTGEIDGAEVVESAGAEAVTAVFGQLNGERSAHAAMAQAAAEALAAMARYRPEALFASLTSLTACLDREDTVAVPALEALGFAAGSGELDAIMAVVADTSRSAPVRAAAASAVAGVLARNRGAMVDAAVLSAAAQEGDGGLARASARALALAGGPPASASVAP